MEQLGIHTIGQLRRLPVEALRKHFGSQGDHFHRLACGIDERAVVPDREAKSISHETTFAADIRDREILRAWLLELTEHVGRRLRKHRLRGSQVQLKIRFPDFRTITRSQTLPAPTNVTEELWQTAAALLERSLPAAFFGVRLLGVGVSGFANREQVQQELFADPEPQKHRDLDGVVDAIQARFGAASLGRGSKLLHGARHWPEARARENDQDGA